MIIITVVIAAIAYSISPEYKMSTPVAFANLLYFLLWWVGLLAWAVRSRRRRSDMDITGLQQHLFKTSCNYPLSVGQACG
jgi:ABC-type transport system involved in Fe-S cluster assembly fused permease/ATPase subunit